MNLKPSQILFGVDLKGNFLLVLDYHDLNHKRAV